MLGAGGARRVAREQGQKTQGWGAWQLLMSQCPHLPGSQAPEGSRGDGRQQREDHWGSEIETSWTFADQKEARGRRTTEILEKAWGIPETCQVTVSPTARVQTPSESAHAQLPGGGTSCTGALCWFGDSQGIRRSFPGVASIPVPRPPGDLVRHTDVEAPPLSP